MLHHLMHGIHFHFALRIPFQGEANSHVLGRFHQQRSIFLLLVGCRLSRQASQQLLQVQPRVRIGFANFFLQSFRTDIWIALHLAETSQQPNRLNHFGFLQRHHAFPRWRGSRTRCGLRSGRRPGYPMPGTVRNAAEGNCRAAGLACAPRVCAAICAATLMSPVRGSAATNFTSLILMVLFWFPLFNASLICLATSCALEPARVNARTRRVKSSMVTSFEKCRLASPAVLKSCPKLRSTWPVSSGTPSSNNILSETPSRNPPSPATGRPCCNSFHATSNWASVRL